jgi:succinate dehydrogenase/fumarate reductase flavoprotein subunit
VPDEIYEYDADVLVVGSGAAAYAAALTAAAEGSSVIMFEKADHVGGTTLLSGGGTAWIPNNSLMRAQGIEDPREDCLRFLCKLSYPQYYDPTDAKLGLPADAYDLIATFYDTGSIALDRLREIGAVDVYFDGVTPDYHSFMPENKAVYGRRCPQTGGSPQMFEVFERCRERLGVGLQLNHRVHSVLRNDTDEVCGLEIRAGVRSVLARARKGVVFGSGGYLHNRELVRTFLPGRVFGGCAAQTNTGDFLSMATEIGAELANMGRAWWKQILVEQAIAAPDALGVFAAGGDSMIQVNRYGRRVVNEKAPYNERGQIHSQWDPSNREYPNLVLFPIWDQAATEIADLGTQRIPLPEVGEAPGRHVVSGSTFSELAAALDERLVELAPYTGGVRLHSTFVPQLEATVERYNEFARTGNDLDFRRGQNAIEVKWTGTGRPGSPNPTMAPFASSGPYFASVVGAGCLDTNGGPRINTDAQVIGRGGSPIPGLFGAGNCVGSITGQGYWGPGGTIGPAIVYGYIAGLSATREKEKPFL